MTTKKTSNNSDVIPIREAVTSNPHIDGVNTLQMQCAPNLYDKQKPTKNSFHSYFLQTGLKNKIHLKYHIAELFFRRLISIFLENFF